MKKVLITGGAGFVGHHLIEHILKNTDWEIVTTDRLDTSGNLNRLKSIECWPTEGHRVRFVWHDLKSEINEMIAQQLGGPFDYIFHLAAGSHVDRSIEDPMLFFMDNCIGTVNLLLYARDKGLTKEKERVIEIQLNPDRDFRQAMIQVENEEGVITKMSEDKARSVGTFVIAPFRKAGEADKITGKFLYFSTDEVFGPSPMDGDFIGFKEWDRLNPNNPYAAAKAAAEMAVISFANTYRIPCVMTNTMNIFGERQHPEKFIPMLIRNSLNGTKTLIHANKERTQAGKRHYLHARNICAATIWAAENGKTLDGSATQGRYNVVGEIELDNEQLAILIHKLVAEECGHEIPPISYELVDFHSSRPGHDLRYSLDGAYLASQGFQYPVAFEDSLRKMVKWTLDHQSEWL